MAGTALILTRTRTRTRTLALTLTLTLTRYTNVVRRTAACRNSLQPRWDADFHLLIRIEDELELLVEARGRYREMWGDVGRYRGDVGRYRADIGSAPSERSRVTHGTRAD